MGEVCQLRTPDAIPNEGTVFKRRTFENDDTLPPFLDSFWKRLNLFRPPGMTDARFAQRLGVHRSTLARWKRGKRPSTTEAYDRLAAELYNISPLWLANGFGSKTMALPDGKRVSMIPGDVWFVDWWENPDGTIRHSWEQEHSGGEA